MHQSDYIIFAILPYDSYFNYKGVKMAYSNFERISLLLQAEAVSGIDSGLAQLIEKAIRDGNEWAINWQYGGQFLDVEETPPHVKLVAEILDFYSIIEDHVEDFSDEDKAILENANINYKYQGFDGNRETEYRSAARFFLEELNLWPEFEIRKNLNTHMPIVDRYRRYLERYEQAIQPEGLTVLTAADVVEIFAR